MPNTGPSPKLGLGVGLAPSDLRLPGGRGRRKRRSPNTSASAGQRHIFSEITACSARVPGIRLHRAWHCEAHLPRGRLGMHHAPPSTPPWWSRNTLATHVRATRQSRKVLQSPVLRVALVFSADDSLSFRFPRTCACARCFDVLAVSCYFLLRFARLFVYVCLRNILDLNMFVPYDSTYFSKMCSRFKAPLQVRAHRSDISFVRACRCERGLVQ